jgi:hypothetical protein
MTHAEALAILIAAELASIDDVCKASELILSNNHAGCFEKGATISFQLNQIARLNSESKEHAMIYDDAIAVLRNADVHDDTSVFSAAEIVLRYAEVAASYRHAAAVITEAVRAQRPSRRPDDGHQGTNHTAR